MAYMTGYPILGITSNMLQLIIIDHEDSDFHILSYYEEFHTAIKDGNLTDANELITKIKKIYKKTNFFLNSQISDAIVVFPETLSTITKTDVYMDLPNEGTEITVNHIRDLFRAAAKQVKANNQTLLNVFPVSFSVSGISDIENPKGLIGQNIELDAFSITAPKDILLNILYSVEQAGVTVLEIMPTFYCNIVEVANSLNLKNGNIVDIAFDHTMISIYGNATPQKSRLIKRGIDGFLQILIDKYQISYDNALDLLKSSVYLDESTAEDIVVYQLELPSGVLDITEQDLAQNFSEYLSLLLGEVKEILEYFSYYSDNPVIFVGWLLRIPGFKELITRTFDEHEVLFYESDIVGMREFSITHLIGCAKILPKREILLQTAFETAQTENIDLRREPKKWKQETTTKMKEKETTLWDKVVNYFFD